MKRQQRVNRQIRANKIRLVTDGSMSEEMDIRDALKLSEEQGLDLLEVSPGEIPVCKLIDFGKLKYEQSKKAKHHKVSATKEIRIGYQIDQHDLDIKHKKIIEFLNKKHNVKYRMELRGRQMAYRSEAAERFKKSLEVFAEVAKWGDVQVSGRSISVMLSPIP